MTQYKAGKLGGRTFFHVRDDDGVIIGRKCGECGKEIKGDRVAFINHKCDTKKKTAPPAGSPGAKP
jgi:hypothetical protein